MVLDNQKGKTLKLALEDSTSIILESISDGVFTVDLNWRITSFNRAAEEITGISRKEAIGKFCSEVFRSNMCEGDCALRRTLESGIPIVNKSGFMVDFKGRQIPISVSTAILVDKKGNVMGGVETFRDLSLVEELRKEISKKFQMGDLVSRSASMQKVFQILPQVAASTSTVLLQGETGTGKELLARTIHNLSPRNNKPFVAVNCSALPETLLESELFGYKAGAFTGADKDKPGRFALADGGTLFLDEIGEISPAFQVMMLRVLQDKTFEPLGGVKSVKVDVRVIAATNRDLAGDVKKGKFRQDLYYRINVVKMELPPLRERKEDIPLLIEHFISRLNRLQGKSIAGVTQDVLAVMLAHDYPGNIRELENAIEHAFVLCPGDQIELEHLPENMTYKAQPSLKSNDINTTVKAATAQTIIEALRKNSNNRLKTAQALGIHKSTLYRKMKALGLQVKKQ